MPSIHSFGVVGLGKWAPAWRPMRSKRAFTVAGVDTHTIHEDLKNAGLKPAADLKELAALLPRPRIRNALHAGRARRSRLRWRNGPTR